MLVVGDKEMETGQVAVRSRRGDDLGSMPREEFITMAQQEINEKTIK
jgi:threonyl-tRNA synthetase